MHTKALFLLFVPCARQVTIGVAWKKIVALLWFVAIIASWNA